MARTVSVVEDEIALHQSYLNEWIKPLIDSSITNRFTQAIINGVVDDKINDSSKWETLDGYILGNSNQFCIFDIGLNNLNQDAIVNAYEIGNESHHIGAQGAESLDTLRLWRANLISNAGVYNNIHTDDSHLVPYYPDNAIKYVSYLRPLLRLDGTTRVVEIDSFLESTIDSYNISYLEFSDSDIVQSNEISSVTNSQIQEIDFTTPANDGIFEAYYEPININSVLRTDIYTAFCEAMSWWFDDTGEIAEWHNGDQGVYTGRRKIVSSWNIYEWILSEIDELNRERTEILGRTTQEIEAGVTIGEIISDIGYDSAFRLMFNEYPGIFNSVRIQLGYYTIDSDDPGFTEASIVQKYGYKSIDTIKAGFDTMQDDNINVSFENLKSCFVFERTEAVSYTIYSSIEDEPNIIVNSNVHIYRLDYDKYFTYNAKNRYYLGTYFIGMKVDWTEPCEWDGLITFIIVVIITYFLGPEAGATSLEAFAAYLAIFSLWVNFLQLGGSQDRKIIGYAAMAVNIYSAWKSAMIRVEAKAMTDVARDMAERKVAYAIAMKSVVAISLIYLQEAKDNLPENDNSSIEDSFETIKNSKMSRNDRADHVDSNQFYPLERLLVKKEVRENKQNKQEFINYRLKENYGRH